VIFVDTGYLFAFFSEDDANHARVAEVLEAFKGRNLPEILVTTDHVVSETITLTRYRISHERAVFVGKRLYGEKMARIHRASFEEQRAAFDYREALAVDEDFTHRFVAWPGPRPKR
jgi:predicted nucleic acid-binding protein